MNAVCARRDIRDVRVISANGGTDMACLSDPDCFSRVGTVSFFLGTADRAGLPLGNVEPASVHFHRALRAVKDVYRANVHMVEVTEPDEEGYLYFGGARRVLVAGGTLVRKARISDKRKPAADGWKVQPHPRERSHGTVPLRP